MLFKGHYRLEKNSIALVLAIIVVSGIGGLVEIAPLFTIDDTVEEVTDMRVYTPLELAGRNIYMREGCYACHSQMIRTCLLYTSPSPRDGLLSRMPSSA